MKLKIVFFEKEKQTLEMEVKAFWFGFSADPFGTHSVTMQLPDNTQQIKFFRGNIAVMAS